MTADAIPRALSIAGSDPTGGAGLQLDVQVFAHHDVHGMAVPTALTVQTTTGIRRTLPAFPNVVGEQLEALLSDVVPDVIKIGMLATDDVLIRVAAILERHSLPRVIDPVLQASDGSYLLERRAWGNLVSRLIAGAALVTPNLAEAEMLTGFADPERAARALLDEGAQAALVKGGHAEGPPDDFLLSGTEGLWLRGKRRDVGAVHGTGCALSAAISARLARGETLENASQSAKQWLEEAIANASPMGSGSKILRLTHA